MLPETGVVRNAAEGAYVGSATPEGQSLVLLACCLALETEGWHTSGHHVARTRRWQLRRQCPQRIQQQAQWWAQLHHQGSAWEQSAQFSLVAEPTYQWSP